MNYLRCYGTPVNIHVDKRISLKHFHCFRIFKFYKILPTKNVFKFSGKVKIIKAPAGFELITYGFVVKATLIGNYHGKERIIKL